MRSIGSRQRPVTALACLAAGLWAAAASASPGFFEAVRQDDHGTVQRHLAAGVAPNVLAASLYHVVSGEMTTTLLEGGADPEVFIRDGGNALHWAVHYGKRDVVRALIDYGVDVDARMTSPGGFKNDCDTALQLVFWKGNESALEIAQMLVDARANVKSASCGSAFTGLHMAAKYGRDPAMIDLMLDAGSDPLARLTRSSRGDAGKTPLDLARKYNPRILRSDAGRRLQAATRRVGMDEPGCDGVVVQPSDKKLSWLAERTLGRASRWREIVELNSLEGRGYRAGQCLKLPA